MTSHPTSNQRPNTSLATLPGSTAGHPAGAMPTETHGDSPQNDARPSIPPITEWYRPGPSQPECCSTLAQLNASLPPDARAHRSTVLKPAAMTITRQPLPALLSAPGVRYRGLHPKKQEQIFRLPLPDNVDRSFTKIRITSRGQSGFMLKRCVNLQSKENYPNATIVDAVDEAKVVLDEFIPGNSVGIQRGLLPKEDLPVQAKRPMVKDPERGFTVAHLLTTMIRKQDNAFKQAVKKSNGMAGVDYIAHHYIAFDYLCIVAVTRTDGQDGVVRWLPVLEARIPHRDWA